LVWLKGSLLVQRVEEELPLKQGLKHLSRKNIRLSGVVEEELPLKQGLKRSD